jgi:hypothetical protein
MFRVSHFTGGSGVGTRSQTIDLTPGRHQGDEAGGEPHKEDPTLTPPHLGVGLADSHRDHEDGYTPEHMPACDLLGQKWSSGLALAVRKPCPWAPPKHSLCREHPLPQACGSTLSAPQDGGF